MEQIVKLKQQKNPQNLTARSRKDTYVKFLTDFPIGSTLTVLKEYENKEYYEECAIIRDALCEYKEQTETPLSKVVGFPMTIEQYYDKGFQKRLSKYIEIPQEDIDRKVIDIKNILPIKKTTNEL